LAPTKFAGLAVTVLLKKEEHKEGAKASQGMLDAIDASPAGSVYVMVLEDGENYAGIGGLMATAMKARGFAGAIIDGGVRDLPQIQKLQFPVFSRRTIDDHQPLPLRGRQHSGHVRRCRGGGKRHHCCGP
jgi:regulator of RNase E activity RraA